MAKEILEEDVRKALGQIKHPVIDHTLLDLGIVKKISTKENKDTIIMAFPFPNITIGDYLVNSVREPIEKVGAEVEVEITVMNQEELERFLAMKQER